MKTLDSADSAGSEAGATPSTQLVVGNQTFSVSEVDEYGFESADGIAIAAVGTVIEGRMARGDLDTDVKFIVRPGASDMQPTYRFRDLSLAEQHGLAAIAKAHNNPEGRNDELASLSYDELAEGKTTRVEAKNSDGAKKTKKTGNTKAVAALFFILGIAAIAILTVRFISSRSTVKISNAAMVGNYQSIPANMHGIITKILVKQGDDVKKGQLLGYMVNDSQSEGRPIVESELSTAKRTLLAYEKQVKKHNDNLAVARALILGKVEVAEARINKAKVIEENMEDTHERFEKLYTRGAVAQRELAEARAEANTAGADTNIERALLKELLVELSANERGILMNGSRMDHSSNADLTKYEIAKAQVTELEERLQSYDTGGDFPIYAPREGTVYAVYKQEGQFVKAAESILSISLDEEYWALGHVPSGSATDVRPGQSVKLNIPSMKAQFDGKITAVGHRALYSAGGWNNDFRGHSTDVPIKVSLDEIDMPIPSGIRLVMTVKLKDKQPWDNAIESIKESTKNLKETITHKLSGRTDDAQANAKKEATTKGDFTPYQAMVSGPGMEPEEENNSSVAVAANKSGTTLPVYKAVPAAE